MVHARGVQRIGAAALALGALLLAGVPAQAGAATARHAASRRAAVRKPKPSPPRGAAAQQAAINQQHALQAYAAMQSAYYNPSLGLYPQTYAWPYSQAMAATISIAALPGLHARYSADLTARLSGLQAYADHTDPPPAGYISTLAGTTPVGARFNDDNEWIGIELLRLYHLTRLPSLLSTASGLMTMVTNQWDTSSGIGCPGGIPWESIALNGDRNTVSNATAAELGAQLYLTTGNNADLQWAIGIYNWVRSCLLHADGLYGDHIDGHGNLDPTEWTYNQGTMIGAGVMLYQATHNPGYLDQAETTAQAGLSIFTPQDLAVQPLSFDAIYIRNVLLLGGVSGDPRYVRFAQWFANDEWYNVRSAASGLFLADPNGQTQLLDQAAMTQVYALLAEPPSAYF
jgi:glycosyl hydrolase family 76